MGSFCCIVGRVVDWCAYQHPKLDVFQAINMMLSRVLKNPEFALFARMVAAVGVPFMLSEEMDVVFWGPCIFFLVVSVILYFHEKIVKLHHLDKQKS